METAVPMANAITTGPTLVPLGSAGGASEAGTGMLVMKSPLLQIFVTEHCDGDRYRAIVGPAGGSSGAAARWAAQQVDGEHDDEGQDHGSECHQRAAMLHGISSAE